MGIDRMVNRVVGGLSLSIVQLKALNCQLLSHLTCSGIWSASLLNVLNPQSLVANQRFLFIYLFPRLRPMYLTIHSC